MNDTYKETKIKAVYWAVRDAVNRAVNWPVHGAVNGAVNWPVNETVHEVVEGAVGKPVDANTPVRVEAIDLLRSMGCDS